MRTLFTFCAALGLVLSASGRLHGAEKRKARPGMECLKPLVKDLRSLLRKFPLKSQDKLRTTAIQNHRRRFDDCLREVQSTLKNKAQKVGTYAQVFSDYVNGLKRAGQTFRTQRVRREQQAYVQACQRVADMRLKLTKPTGSGYSAQAAFNEFIKRLKRVQYDLRTNDKLRQAGFTYAQRIFDQELKEVELGNLASREHMWERNAKRARREFPTSSDALKKRNEKPAKLIEQAAKKIMDRQAAVAKRGRRR